MASKILTEYKQKITGLELEPAGGGCFELSTNGDSIYSKLQTGEFPDENEMVAAIGQCLK